jgi:lysozyme family protein
MTDLNALKVANAKRFALAKITRDASSAASRLVAAKQRYITVSLKTGVPWFVIAVIHERESSQSWFASLAQGDPWNKVSVHVPAGRGPFQSWEEAAIDALVDMRTLRGALDRLEPRRRADLAGDLQRSRLRESWRSITLHLVWHRSVYLGEIRAGWGL